MDKLKYKIIGKSPYDLVSDLLETLLFERGVKDVNALINVDKNCVLDPFLLENMKDGVDLIHKHIQNKSKIKIIIDSDADGYTSSAIVYNYLNKYLNHTCSYLIHNGKQHGIVMEEFEDFNFDLLIVPDGGSSDYEQHYALKEKGIDILILDHHNATTFSKCACVINPNIAESTYPNKSLCGAGVSYKFCQALDIFYKQSYADLFLDLVACGNIGDSMDLRSLETRFLTLRGIKLLEYDKEMSELGKETIGNKFLRAIVEKKKERDLKKINITSIGWKLIPIINGTIRAGTMDEKIDMFKAFIESKDDRWYQPRRKKKEDQKPEKILMSLQEDMVRVCTNIKGRQDRNTKKITELIEQRIQEKKLDSRKIIIINATDIIDDGNMTGLIANKIASAHNKPVLLLREKDDKSFGGSARNFRMSPIEDLRGLINTTHIKGMGHDNAFGLHVQKDKIVKSSKILEESLKDVIMENVYLVDYKIPIGRLKGEDVVKVGKLRDYWGNTLPEPKFIITNISMKVSEIELIGDKRNILKFKKNGITFIKFFASEDYLNKITMKQKKGFGKNPDLVTLNIIGIFDINEYEGKNYPQIIIDDFDVCEKEEILF